MKYILLLVFVVLFIPSRSSYCQNEVIKSYPFKLSYKSPISGDTIFSKEIVKLDDITEITFTTDRFTLPEKQLDMPYKSIYSISIPSGRNTVVPIVQGSLVGGLAGLLIGSVTHWPFKSESGSSLIYGGICTVIGGAIGYFLGSRVIGFREYSLKGLSNYEMQLKIKEVLRRNVHAKP